MPIKVTCACGQSFAAKDELAGKTVKCPKCAQPLKIPSPAVAAAGAVRAKAPAAAPAPVSSMHSLFDDAGVQAAPAPGANLCHGCAQPMPADAVLCIKCGYNVKLGRKMQTMSSSAAAAGGGDPHGGAAATLLARAAEAIDDAEAEEKKKTGEGLPWWGYLISLCAVVGFMVMMMTLPMAVAFIAAAVLFYLVGALVSFYSWIRLIILAFEEGVVHGVLSFIGLYQLYYIFSRWDRCSGYFFMNLAGGGLMFAGAGMVWLAGIAAEWKTEEEDARLPRPPAVVVAANFAPCISLAGGSLQNPT